MTMKPTDLMLGDFVFASPVSEFPMRVTLIDEGGCYLNFEGNEGDPFDGDFGEEGMQPIPLTPEILKANGWEEKEETNGWEGRVEIKLCYFNPESCCFFEWYLSSRALFISGGMIPLPVQFVHQMQHALRLCGKGEWADNFKIQ